MKNSKIKKEKNKVFVETVCKGLIELGAKKVKDQINNFKTFELDTIVGKLNINIVIDNFACYTVFAKFKDVARAKEKFDCNPYSGKYNVHIGAAPELSGEKAAEIALAAFWSTTSK